LEVLLIGKPLTFNLPKIGNSMNPLASTKYTQLLQLLPLNLIAPAFPNPVFPHHLQIERAGHFRIIGRNNDQQIIRLDFFLIS
jgi:hypothetical protein